MSDLGRLIDALEIPGSATPPKSLLAAAYRVTGDREIGRPRGKRRLFKSVGSNSSRRRALLAVVAAVVALVLLCTLTGPGRAVAEQIGKLVGIGDAEQRTQRLFDEMQESKPGPVGNPQRRFGPEVDYVVDGPPSDRQVHLCRKDPVEGGAGDPLLCTLILAVASGDVEPGNYTTEEVERFRNRH